MKICRFDKDRLGIVQGDEVLDVTKALEAIPGQSWPLAQGDPLILNFKRVLAAAKKFAPKAKKKALAKAKLLSPVANPSKIIGAPINYHEVELALVIGKRGNKIPREKALEYVCAYSIGLDMTVRGPELQCFRKSIDTYSVLGPWLVTADEIGDPDALDLSIRVNGELRQNSNTKYLVYSVERLIAFASAMYTLHPGDIIMTGTPAGVSPVKPGDLLHAYVQGVGESDIRIAPEYA